VSPAPDTATRHALVAVVTTAAVVAVLWAIGWLPSVERIASDRLLRLTRPAGPTPPVAAVVIDEASIDAVGPLPWSRERIAAVVERITAAGARGVAVDLLLSEPGDRAADLALAAALDAGPALLSAVIVDGRWVLPHATFGGSRRAAHAHAEVGPDGVVRTILETKQAGGLSLPALSLAAARIVDPGLAVTPGRVLRPAFRPAPGDIPSMSASEVLEGREPIDVVTGRVVFVGVTAAGAGDQFVVPTGSRHAPEPGVLVHASAAASILSGRLLHATGATTAVLAAVLMAAVAQWWRTSSGRLRGIHPLLLVVIAIAVGWLGLRLHLLLPVATLAVAGPMAMLVREGLETRAVRRETGGLLATLRDAVDAPGPEPRSAPERLEVLRVLQERVVAERELRGSLLEGMAEGVVMLDSGGGLAYANPAADRLWGGHPEAHELPTDGDSAEVHRGGRVLEVRSAPLPHGTLVLLHDVTADRELERRRRDMQRLVSHELRTPLASIGGLAETLERYEMNADELQRVAGLIRGESVRLSRMVSTFLDLERLGTGSWDDRRGVLDLAALTADRLELLDAADHGLERELVAEGPVSVDGVPELLERVVDNLVGNALRYTPSGGHVRVRVSRSDGDAVLEVADDGPGIPPEARQRLFDRFYRVPGAVGGGSGLGLALVREVVDWHGGCIEIDSEIGAGSTFTVRLPAAESGMTS